VSSGARYPLELTVNGRSGGREVAGSRTILDGRIGQAFYDPPTQMLDKDFCGNVSVTYGFAAQAALVEFEMVTGKIEVVRVTSPHDVGRPLNPVGCEAQIEGGIHMDLGYCLTEEFRLRTDGF
jgi:CO/xanthine dehydrogenase Mo-binding subunit